MDYIEDFLLVTKESFKKTVESLRKNYMIIFTGLAYMLISGIMLVISFALFRGPLSIIFAIISTIVSIGMLSSYLNILSSIINYNRFSFDDFKDGFTVYLRKIWNIFFYYWIFSILLDLMRSMVPGGAWVLDIIVTISIFIVLNALPETIYQKMYNPLDSIVYSIDFMKDNWLNWSLSNLPMYLLVYLVTGRFNMNILSTGVSPLLLGGYKIPAYLLGQVIFSFMMIYRGHLFKLLSTSTRRKRMFMRKL